MSEIWKGIYFVENDIIYDYRGLYQVSNYGRVKSLGNDKTRKEKILKARNTRGYEDVVLCKNCKPKHFKVHRLVAHMFIDGYFDGADVDHIDTDRTNNHVSNLRWCSRKENCNNELSKKHYSKAKKGKALSEETKKKMSEANKGKFTGEKNGRAILVDRFTLDGIYVDTKYPFEYVQLGFNAGGISSCCGWYACGEDINEWHKIRKGYPVKSVKGYIFKYFEN